jgi:peroxiredoxin
MGLRSNRYSMLVKDGKVATLNIEAPGKFEVSDAATLLAQAKG